MMLSFGQFLIQITESTTLNDPLFPSWKKYQTEVKDFPPDVELVLSKDSFPLCDTIDEGWSYSDISGEPYPVYFSKGKEVFALQFGKNERTVKVTIDHERSHATQIGIQYGLMIGLYQTCIGLHGVTVLCGNEIIILSAPSGTGKTTLAKLLERYCDAIVINGDFALLHSTEDRVIFEPTPFCGTSGRSLNHRFQVDRIVFLGQAKSNRWKELSGREAMRQFLDNAFVPTWDPSIQQTVQENILKCLSMVQVNSYEFAPTQEAAETFIQHILN